MKTADSSIMSPISSDIIQFIQFYSILKDFVDGAFPYSETLSHSVTVWEGMSGADLRQVRMFTCSCPNVKSCFFSTWSFRCKTAAQIQLGVKEQKEHVNICVLTYNFDPFHSTLRYLCDDCIYFFVAGYEIFPATYTLFSVTVNKTFWG